MQHRENLSKKLRWKPSFEILELPALAKDMPIVRPAEVEKNDENWGGAVWVGLFGIVFQREKGWEHVIFSSVKSEHFQIMNIMNPLVAK